MKVRPVYSCIPTNIPEKELVEVTPIPNLIDLTRANENPWYLGYAMRVA